MSRRWPALIRKQVFDRDHGVCARCALDTEALKRELAALPAEQRVARERHLGWPKHRVDFWDADHITPVAEGGPCELDNLRTLCLPCHREVTGHLMARLTRRALAARPTKPVQRVGDGPGDDGGWWIATGTQSIECPRCGKDVDDRPAVMRYVPAADIGGIMARHRGDWVRDGWKIWRECARCAWADHGSETATLQQIRAWQIGPWREMYP